MGLLEYALNGARILNGPLPVHGGDRCDGERCPIHNPGQHHMARWSLTIRASGLTERVCVHGVGHPDPDSVRWLTRETGETHWGTHGCDGCCAPRQLVPA